MMRYLDRHQGRVTPEHFAPPGKDLRSSESRASGNFSLHPKYDDLPDKLAAKKMESNYVSSKKSRP